MSKTSLYPRRSLFVFAAWICCIALPAQQLPLRKIGLKEGLPQSTVFRMRQDNVGYMWFATQGGLCRYDGVNCKIYSQYDGAGSNFIRHIEFDEKGKLWIATIDKGISCFDGKNFSFINTSTGLLSNEIRHFYKTRSGHYFICTVNKGVIWVDPYLNQTVILTPEGDTIQYAREVIELDNGKVWVAHGSGILELDPAKRYRARHIMKDQPEMISLCKDIRGDIWAGGVNTLIEFTRDTFSNYSNILGEGTEVWDILEESTTGKMYCATTNGLLIKKRDDITWLTTANGLTVNDLRSLYRDNNNHIWAGTMGGGAMILENKGIDHFTYTNQTSAFSTNTLAEDGSGNMWIGTNKQGIIYSDKKEARHSPAVKPGDMLDPLSSTYDRASGSVWMADYDGRIIKINDGKIKWRWSPQGKGTMRLLNISYHKNALYLSTQTGFYTLTEKDGKLNKIEALGNAYYSYSFPDKLGNIWILGDQGAVHKLYNGKAYDYTDRINPKRFSLTQGIYDPLHHLYWFCSYSGLIVWDNRHVYHLHSQNGLYSDSPWSISQDRNGDIWLGHPNGIERLSYRTRSSKAFGYDQGFTPIETNSCAIHCDRNGNIWFGTVNSATRIRVDDISLRKSIVNLCIQKIWTGEKLFFEQDLQHEAEDMISLSYRKNNITLDLTGICFENAGDVNYSWYLQGFDNDWTNWDTHTKAVYANLKPGTYIFRAKAKDSNGYETQQLKLKIIIRKPIWNYWWFYLAEVCLMACIIYFSFRFSADPDKNKIGNIFTLVSILIIFEGLLIYVSDYVNSLTAGIPIFQLIMNVILAASLHPIEMFIRKFMRKWAIRKRRKNAGAQASLNN